MVEYEQARIGMPEFRLRHPDQGSGSHLNRQGIRMKSQVDIQWHALEAPLCVGAIASAIWQGRNYIIFRALYQSKYIYMNSQRYNSKYLYWVYDISHCEDWFIIAKDKKSACKFHEDYEGFGRGTAKAKEIQIISKAYKRNKAYHAQLDMLLDLGFTIVSERPYRIVFRDGKTYREKTTIESVLKEHSYAKEGLYVLRTAGTDLYKIGITKDLKKRLSNIQTGSPIPIEIYAFYPTEEYKSLEQSLHKLFHKRTIGGEWFKLSKEDINELHTFALKVSKVYYGFTGIIPRIMLGDY